MFSPQLIETSLHVALNLEIAVANSMVFTQTDDLGIFLMDESQSYGSPDPPQLGGLETFTLGGLWTQPVDLDHVNFQCHLFGVLVYNENFPDQESVEPGMWTYGVPFDVPAVAPATTYYITVNGYDTAGEIVFTIKTDFKF